MELGELADEGIFEGKPEGEELLGKLRLGVTVLGLLVVLDGALVRELEGDPDEGALLGKLELGPMVAG